MTRRSCLAALLALAWCSAQHAQEGSETHEERIRLEPIELGAAVAGRITGYESVDYLVAARAGQTLAVSLETSHGANYFNVLPPDSENEATYVGQTGGNDFEGRLDLDGDWRIRVYLMRAAARRGETAEFRLRVAVSGEPDPAAAREPSTFGPLHWDASGHLGCARGGQPTQPAGCPFKVIRYAGGATIYVLAPGSGDERILYFESGAWSTYPADEVDVRQRDDLWELQISGEAYEVPDAVITGG